MKTKGIEPGVALIFLWGLLLLLVAVRLYFWKPVVIPTNSKVKFETEVAKLDLSEHGFRISVENIVIFVPSYPRISVGDRLLVEGYIDRRGRMFEPKVEIIGHRDTIGSKLWGFRQDLVSRVEALLPPREATLVSGTVFGVDRIGSEFRNALTKTGTIHVVVVSGQNLSILAGIFLYLARYLGRRISMVFAVGVCLLYALLTGFEPPVIRALLMVVVSTLAVFLGRASTAIVALFVVCLVIVSIWPQMIVSISFQLTFAATLGILTFGSFLARRIRIPVVGEVTAVCVGAYAFSAPVILYHFGSVSILSPIVNIIVSESVLPIMLLGFVLSVAAIVSSSVAQIVAYAVFVPAHFFVKVVEFFAAFEGFSIRGGTASATSFVFAMLVIVGLYFVWKGYRKGTD